MDAAQWAQQIGGYAKAMEEIPITPNSTNQPMIERKLSRPQNDQNLNCPRCNSTNTKFCYYNNYSLTQPRYFCKTCRRYWTQGGSLRNVPVGGGSRKNKRSNNSSSSASSLSSSSSTPAKIIPDLNPPAGSFSNNFFNNGPTQNPKFLQGQDLNLAFPIQGIFHQFPKIENINGNNLSTKGNLSSYVPMSMAMQDSISVYPNNQDHHELSDNNMVGSGAPNNNGARLLFPFADMNKLASSTTQNHDDQRKEGCDADDHHHQVPTGYWTGMLGGGNW